MLIDLKLAQRLEEAEAFTAEAYARALSRRNPQADIAIEEVAGGRAVFVGVGSPLTETKAIGLRGPVTESDLGRMESVFFSRGDASRVVVCPLADPSLIVGLGRRGYRLFGFEDILALPLDQDDPNVFLFPYIEIRPVELKDQDLYANVVAPNFVGPEGSMDDIVNMIHTMVAMEHAMSFLAYIDGVPVGGGSVLIREGLALLAGAATLAPFRNRGVHAALHTARIKLARQSECDLAAQGAHPGSTSERNAQRRGFRVVYTRAFLVKNPL
jgi:hypothetical protein